MAHRQLFHQKILEKLGSISEQKQTLTDTLHNFVDESSSQFTHILQDEEDSFLLESYMGMMTVLDQCLNSLVMLTAVADTVHDSYSKSMKGLLKGSSSTSCSVPVVKKETPKDLRSSAPEKQRMTSSSTPTTYGSDKQKMTSSSTLATNGHRSASINNGPSLSAGVIVNKTRGENLSASNRLPNNKVEVYIGNLQSEVTDADIENLVGKFNPISFRCLTKKEDNRKKFAFVSFGKLSDAEECAKTLKDKSHKGRFLRVHLTKNYEEQTPPTAAPVMVSPENDSCYNSLTADKRGNYSLCYPKEKEPAPNKQAVKERFDSFGDYHECHFTGRFIFVRFKSKKSAVAAYEKLYKELDMKIPRSGSRNKSSRQIESDHSDMDNVYCEIPDEPCSSNVRWGQLTSPGRTDQSSESGDLEFTSATGDSPHEGVYCVPQIRTDSLSADSNNLSSADRSNSSSCDGINFSYLKQLQKIWDN